MIICLFQGSCSFLAACEDDVRNRTISPNGNYVARELVRNCGATTDYSTLVKVSQSEAYSDDEDVVFVARYDQEIRLIWKNDSILQIACDGCKKADIFKQGVLCETWLSPTENKEDLWA